MRRLTLLLLLVALIPLSSAQLIKWTEISNNAEATLYVFSEDEFSKWTTYSSLATITTTGNVGLLESGYGPGAVFTCYNPYIIQDDGTLAKGYWLTNTKPSKVVWEFYDPTYHRIQITKKPSIVKEGDFNGYRYIVADEISFEIPAFAKPGKWLVRSYFIDSEGNRFGEGPAVDSEGNAYLISFTVISGSWIDKIFRAPAFYFNGHPMPALFWLLAPIWLPLVALAVLAIIAGGLDKAVDIIKSSVEKIKRAREKWRK